MKRLRPKVAAPALACVVAGVCLGILIRNSRSGSERNSAVPRGSVGQHGDSPKSSGGRFAEKPEIQVQRGSRADMLLAEKNWLGLETFLSEWATRDPYGALEWALSLEMPFRKEAVAQIILGWLKNDPEGAIVWARSYDREILEDKRLYSSLVAEGNVELALKVLDSSSYQPFAANALFAEWARRDLDAARIYLDESAKKDTGKWLLSASAVASEWATFDLAGAVYWIEKNASGNSERLLIRDAVSSAIRAADGTDLGAIAANLPQGLERDGFYLALASQSVARNPVTAADWLARISDPNLRASDVVVVNQIAEARPDLAAALIEQLASASARDLRLRNLVMRWAQSDPGAALAYAQGSQGISDITKQQILVALAPRH